MKHNGQRRPEEIVQEIDRTRMDMDATLQAIERRLTPGEIMDRGINYMRSSGANEFVSNLGTAIKQNPLPLALVGLGVAWMMMADRRAAQPYTGTASDWRMRASDASASAGDRMRGVSEAARARIEGTTDSAREAFGHGSESLGYAGESAQERAGRAADSLRDKASRAADSARSGIAAMRERGSAYGDAARERMSALGERGSELSRAAREKWEAARERGARMSDSAMRQVGRARDSAERMARERPLMLGAAALAIGAVVAAALPRTRREDELMGETSDRVTEKAKELGQEQLEKAQRVAETAQETVAEEAKREFAQPQGA